jgi:hypothetical protein
MTPYRANLCLAAVMVFIANVAVPFRFELTALEAVVLAFCTIHLPVFTWRQS